MSPISLWIVKHIAGGGAFFSGASLLLLAAIWRLRGWRGGERLVFLLCGAGGTLVILSATPLPVWYGTLAAIVSLLWFLQGWRRPLPAMEADSPTSDAAGSGRAAPRRQLSAIFAAVWLAGMAWEFPRRWSPRVPPTAACLTVIGDSISAGVGDGTVTWPEILRWRHDLDVVDLSHVGETAASAVKRLGGRQIPSGIVLIEIGGNDLLGGTTPGEFHRSLNELLGQVSGPGRQLILFELPLPPFKGPFGRIQRKLAREYQAELIPKRILIDVLLSPETTLDSIHLTQAGHEKLADVVWKIIGPAVGTE